jgi:phytoene/squalene synthetase
MVTAFIRSRGQGLIDREWQDLSDWELDDTKNLPRKAIAKVVEFIAEEQNAETQEAMAAKKARKRNGPQ